MKTTVGATRTPGILRCQLGGACRRVACKLEGWLRGCVLSLGLAILSGQAIHAAEVVQEFFVPLPEAQVYQANNTIVAGTGSAISSTISIHIVSDGTVIYYDQWEDGYEAALATPAQPTTLIWGDGNDAHGIPPGMAHNPLGLQAGTIINLTNVVATQPRDPTRSFYDGRDRMGATRLIVLTRAHWPSTTGTVIAGAVTVLSTAEWGTNYVSPVGQNMTNSLMSYVGMFVQAAQNNTAVTIDPTGANGAGVTNLVLNQGESFLYNGGLLKGARAMSSKPVQAHLVIGRRGASYAVDWFTLYPVSSWGPNYYTPVGSSAGGNPAYVYLYNPNTNILNLRVSTKVGVATVAVPGTNGVLQYTMPASSGASFIATNGQSFYALCTVNAAPASETTYNWGFSLVPTGALTTAADVGWAPGSADGTANGSPVWVTALKATTLYVAYGGSSATLTDPAGHKYSTNFSISAFQSLKVYDPSKSQTGMRLYTLDGTLITAAWGEDADKAGAGNPYIDAGYTVLPFPVPMLFKSASNLTHPGAGGVVLNDVIQYTVEVANKNPVALEGVVLYDRPSLSMRYVANSTTNVTSAGPRPLADMPGGGFPLASPGHTNAIIPGRSSSIFTYQFVVTNASGVLSNTVTISSASLGSALNSSLSAVSDLASAATYSAPTIGFTAAGGSATNAYPPGLANLFVSVNDAAANQAAGIAETLSVTVSDAASGDSETVVLRETGLNTGIFRNGAGLPSSVTGGFTVNDGTLYVAGGDGITANYVDRTGGSYGASASLTGSSGGHGGGGSSVLATNALYLNTLSNALNRYDPVHNGYGPALVSETIGVGSGGGSNVIFDASAMRDSLATNKSLTIPFTTGSNPNRLMVVGVAYGAPANNTGLGAVTNVYYGASALTRLAKLVDGSSARVQTEIWYLLNPPSGSNSVSVLMTNSTQEIVAGAATFANVAQTSTFGTLATNALTANTYTKATNIVASAGTELVLQVVGWDGNASGYTNTAGTGQTTLWNSAPPGPNYTTTNSANAVVFGASYKTGQVASTNTWTISSARRFAALGVSIRPAGVIGSSGPATNAVSFLQAPAFSSSFLLASNSPIYITNYITVTNGTFTSSSNVTASLRVDGIDVLTLGNPVLNAGPGVNTNIVWSGILTTNVTVASGKALGFVVSNRVSGLTFHINYGSTNMPSAIYLPAATIISIDSLGIYDAAYPFGSLVTAPIAGSPVYVRATVSDPFGTYDIHHVTLDLTTPSGGTATVAANVVSTTSTNEVVEYQWSAGVEPGTCTVVATAYEGTEGVTATAVTRMTTTFLDLGTPSTLLFTTGPDGGVTNSYPANTPLSVWVQDLNRNTNYSTVDSVTVTVKSSSGDSEPLTLFESGTNSGVFTNNLPTTTNVVGFVTGNGERILATVGAVLTASYVDPTDASDQSTSTAIIQSAPGVAGILCRQTVASPASGQVLVGGFVTYDVEVINVGSTTLSGLAVTSSFPSQLSYFSASVSPTVTSPGVVIWSALGTLLSGQSTNLTVTFIATHTGAAVVHRTWAAGGGQASTDTTSVVVSQVGVGVSKTLLSPGSQPVPIGSNVVFRIVITNTGTTSLASLPLEDVFSGGCFEYVSATLPPAGAGYGALVWTNLVSQAGLGVGGSLTNDVTMRVLGQGSPARSESTVNGAVDSFGNTVPSASCQLNITTAAASVSGYVYRDSTADHTGLYIGTDVGIGGATVTLYATSNNIPAAVLQVTTTGASGYYELVNLAAGAYAVVETVSAGHVPSSAVSLPVTITGLTAYTNISFFSYEPAATAYSTISGTIWNDQNGDGTNTVGEAGVENVAVDLVLDLNSNRLVDAGEPVVRSTLTDTNGTYSFSAVSPGDYLIRESVGFGYYVTGNAQHPGGAGGDLLIFSATNGVSSGGNDFYTRLLPVAVADSVAAFQWTPLNLYPLTNDVSPNGDTLTIVSAASTDGTVMIAEGGGSLAFVATNLGIGAIRYAVADSHGGTSVPGTVSITTSALADVGLRLLAPGSVVASSNLTYTVVVTNAGPSTASGVEVIQSLPHGAVLVSTDAGGVQAGGTATWKLGELAAGGVVVLHATVTAPASGVLSSTAGLSASSADPVASNNSTLPTLTTVIGLADLWVGLSSPVTTESTNILDYLISVTNLGPSSASDVVVTDVLPTGVIFVSATGGGTTNAGVVTWELGTLAAGSVSNVLVSVRPPHSGSITNQAAVAASTLDPDHSNNTSLAVVTEITVVKETQTIDFLGISDQSSTSTVTLAASASSGLAVSFGLVSGPAALMGDLLSFIGTGTVQVFAAQSGNGDYLAAETVTNSFTVRASAQAEIVFHPASPQSFGTTNTLVASSGSGTGDFSYAVLSGPGMIVNDNQLWVTNGAGDVRLSATRAGDALYGPRSVIATVSAVRAPGRLTLDCSPNPAGYGDEVVVSALLGNATGSVQFITNGVSAEEVLIMPGGAANVRLSSLPRGTNVVLAVYTGDANYQGVTNFLFEVVTNHPPQGGSLGYSRQGLNRWKIAIGDLLANVADPDNDSLTVSQVGTSSNGIALVLMSGYLQYYNANIVDDRFTCVVSDGYGGLGQVTISLLGSAKDLPAGGLVGQHITLDVQSEKVLLQFAGVGGYRYQVQRSVDLTTWDTLWTTNAPAAGLFQYQDSSPPQPAGYYRLLWNGN